MFFWDRLVSPPALTQHSDAQWLGHPVSHGGHFGKVVMNL